MKTKILFIAALASAAAWFCSAQTSTSSSGQSGWQLTIPTPPQQFLPDLPTSNASRPSPSPTAGAAIVETAPTQAPYTEGPNWVMTFIKTKSASGNDYLKSIAGSLKPIYDEEKRQKIILDYKILRSEGGSDSDFNIVIMVQYPNRAALEELRERTEPIIQKIIGPADKRRDVAAKRLEIREILASKTMREISLQ